MAPRPPLNIAQTLQFWWLAYRQPLGLVIGVAVILLLGVLLVPRGRSTSHVGVVTGFRTFSTETGTDVYAAVQVDGRSTLVFIRPGNDCTLGGPINLRKTRSPIGERYAERGRGCVAPSLDAKSGVARASASPAPAEP